MIDLTGILFWLLIFSPIIAGWLTPEPPVEAPRGGSKKQRRPPMTERLMFVEEGDE